MNTDSVNFLYASSCKSTSVNLFTTFTKLLITDCLFIRKLILEQSTLSDILWLYIFSIISWAVFNLWRNLTLFPVESPLNSFSKSSKSLNLFKLYFPPDFVFCLKSLLVKYSPVIISILCFKFNIFLISSWKSYFILSKLISKISKRLIPNFSIKGILKS